jgi:hypothetical protein
MGACTIGGVAVVVVVVLSDEVCASAVPAIRINAAVLIIKPCFMFKALLNFIFWFKKIVHAKTSEPASATINPSVNSYSFSFRITLSCVREAGGKDLETLNCGHVPLRLWIFPLQNLGFYEFSGFGADP